MPPNRWAAPGNGLAKCALSTLAPCFLPVPPRSSPGARCRRLAICETRRSLGGGPVCLRSTATLREHLDRRCAWPQAQVHPCLQPRHHTDRPRPEPICEPATIAYCLSIPSTPSTTRPDHTMGFHLSEFVTVERCLQPLHAHVAQLGTTNWRNADRCLHDLLEVGVAVVAAQGV